jgi:putative hydrolase
MRKYPSLKVITHPLYTTLPVDLDALTDVAAETGTALEINNSHMRMGKVNLDRLNEMLEYARLKGTLLAVNSDGHVFTEMGEFDCAITYMEPFRLESFNIVNRTLESSAAFLGVETG